jgi:restriction endonuclease S subunit
MEACVVICRAAKPPERRGKVLLINAVNEVTRERAQSFLTDGHIARIAQAYDRFGDVDGFARVATLEEIRGRAGNLSIPLYVSPNGGTTIAAGDGRAALAEALDAWLASRLAVAEALHAILPDLPMPADDVAVGALNDATLFDREGWQRVRFGDVVDNVNETERNPAEAGIERFIGLEHLEPGSLHIRAWGNVADGTTFTRRCRPGQVLFAKRRAYQRKVAVAEFDAVVSGDIYVLAPKDERLLADLLPFICMSERFFQYAVDTSAGSLSPRTNWTHLAEFEFDLPPLEQQQRLAEVLWAVDDVGCCWRNTTSVAESHARATADSIFEANLRKRHVLATEACDRITVGIVIKPASYYTDPESGVPALRSLNVFPGRYDLSDLVYLTRGGHEKNARSVLKAGDIVVVRTGRPGDAAVVTEQVAGMNLIDLILVQPNPQLLPEYLVEFLNSAFGRREISRGSSGTAQQHFNVSEFERLHIPVPPIDEQRRAVKEIAFAKAQHQHCQAQADLLTALQSAVLGTVLTTGPESSAFGLNTIGASFSDERIPR